MAFFQRAGGPFGTFQRLTKLYNDTKQSYEFAKVTPADANVNDDAEVKALRKDFQIQQDRLLAWGMHWADVEAQYNQGQDVDIDKKIDQAGLGEVVAEVMSQIKSLLDQSGRLQHPEKYEMARTGKSPSSPNLRRDEWSGHEVQTGRALLEQLKTCIDVLYSMTSTRKAEEKSSKGEKSEKGEKGDSKGVRGLEDDVEAALYGPRKSSSAPAFQGLRDHPLHIEWTLIDFSSPTSESADPPPYDAPEPATTESIGERAIGYHRGDNKPILVDFLGPDVPPHVVGTADDIFELHELGQALSKQRKQLSWCGHLRLLGLTVDPNGPRCGLVYELPPGRGYQNLQQHKTLASATAATYKQESTQPALEDRFRLAYNIALSLLGYFANGDSHRNITASNILLIGKDSQGRLSPASLLTKPDVRSPYLLQSCQDFRTKVTSDDPLTATIYRHPTYDVQNNESIVPACDIYSLGLILLEIGFWFPLSKLWKEKYDRQTFMERVQRVYSPKLASKCGTKYMRIVQKCLHAPAELLGKTRPEEAAAHLIEVVKELRHCCALDEEEMPPSSDIECFEFLVIELMCKNESFPSDEPAQSSTLPVLKVPGAFAEEQESGVTRSGMSAVKRKPIERRAVETPQAPGQTQTRRPSKKRQKSASALHKWPEMAIAQEDLDQWNSLLMPKLSKILQDTLHDSPESCSVSLMKIGASQETAKTTICIQCKDTARVNEALRKKFKPKKSWGVVILKGDVKRSGTRRSRNPRRSGGRRGVKPREQKYQEKPSCGASIGAFRDNEHLPPVSFGGTILVDGEPFGMTVHHMLDAPSESESDSSDEEAEHPTRSAAPRAAQTTGMNTSADLSFMTSEEDDLRHFSDLEISSDSHDDADDESEAGSDASTIRPDYSITDSDGNEFWFLDDSSDTSAPDLVEDHSSSEDEEDEDEDSEDEEDDDDAASIGDKPPFLPDHPETESLAVTQPAIDDVDDDFFPNLEDKDEDHLDSHTFGVVHASSGIRRVVKAGLKHELDWALIRIDDDRLDTANSVSHNIPRGGGSRRGRVQRKTTPSIPAVPTLTKVTPQNQLSARTVACRARSSGFSSGRISQAMCLVKLHGRHTFSYSWCVDSVPTTTNVPTIPGATALETSTTRTSRPANSAAAKHTAKGGDLGIPGDSGAWIYDPANGELCGAVLAYGEKLRQCYIAPMEVLFEDIRQRLGASDVRLPGEACVVGAVDASSSLREGGSLRGGDDARFPNEVSGSAAGGILGGGSVVGTKTPIARRDEVWREDSGVDMGDDMRAEAASMARLEAEAEKQLQNQPQQHQNQSQSQAQSQTHLDLRRGLQQLRIAEQPGGARNGENVDVSFSPVKNGGGVSLSDALGARA